MTRGQEGFYDFVKNHDKSCASVFDADYFVFDSEHCASCRAEVERRKSENAKPLVLGEEIFPSLKL